MKKNYLEPEMKLAFFEKEDIVTSSGDLTAEGAAKNKLEEQFSGQSIGIQSVNWNEGVTAVF